MTIGRVEKGIVKPRQINNDTEQTLQEVKDQVFGSLDLLEKIVKQIPYNPGGNLAGVAQAWKKAVEKEHELYRHSMHTIFTIMNHALFEIGQDHWVCYSPLIRNRSI